MSSRSRAKKLHHCCYDPALNPNECGICGGTSAAWVYVQNGDPIPLTNDWSKVTCKRCLDMKVSR